MHGWPAVGVVLLETRGAVSGMVTPNIATAEQVPDGLVEVARSTSDGDLDAAAERLGIEGVAYFAVMTTYLSKSYSRRHVYRILVPPDTVTLAREIISLVNSGAFELPNEFDSTGGG
jgi:hypothetical protein